MPATTSRSSAPEAGACRGGQEQFEVKDLVKGAGLTVTDGSTKGLTLEPFKGFHAEDEQLDDVDADVDADPVEHPRPANRPGRRSAARPFRSLTPGRPLPLFGASSPTLAIAATPRPSTSRRVACPAAPQTAVNGQTAQRQQPAIRHAD